MKKKKGKAQKRSLEGLPERQGKRPDKYFSGSEAARYSTNATTTRIQRELARRTYELLCLAQPSLAGERAVVADLGCGASLCGALLGDWRWAWLGVDISRDMLQHAGPDAAGLTACCDMGQGVPFRAGLLDAAVSISSVQWVCQACDRSESLAPLHRLFHDLSASLRAGSHVVFQVYLDDERYFRWLRRAWRAHGFVGGAFLDFPHNNASRKVFLCLLLERPCEGAGAAGAQPPCEGAVQDEAGWLAKGGAGRSGVPPEGDGAPAGTSEEQSAAGTLPGGRVMSLPACPTAWPHLTPCCASWHLYWHAWHAREAAGGPSLGGEGGLAGSEVGGDGAVAASGEEQAGAGAGEVVGRSDGAVLCADVVQPWLLGREESESLLPVRLLTEHRKLSQRLLRVFRRALVSKMPPGPVHNGQGSAGEGTGSQGLAAEAGSAGGEAGGATGTGQGVDGDCVKGEAGAYTWLGRAEAWGAPGCGCPVAVSVRDATGAVFGSEGRAVAVGEQVTGVSRGVLAGLGLRVGRVTVIAETGASDGDAGEDGDAGSREHTAKKPKLASMHLPELSGVLAEREGVQGVPVQARVLTGGEMSKTLVITVGAEPFLTSAPGQGVRGASDAVAAATNAVLGRVAALGAVSVSGITVVAGPDGLAAGHVLMYIPGALDAADIARAVI